MVLRTTTNHKNNLEKEVSWSDRQVDKGRAILARLEPDYEYDLNVERHIAYSILRDKTCDQGLGPDYFDRLNPEGLRRRLTKRLEGLGFKVTVEPLAEVA